MGRKIINNLQMENVRKPFAIAWKFTSSVPRRHLATARGRERDPIGDTKSELKKFKTPNVTLTSVSFHTVLLNDACSVTVYSINIKPLMTSV